MLYSHVGTKILENTVINSQRHLVSQHPLPNLRFPSLGPLEPIRRVLKVLDGLVNLLIRGHYERSILYDRLVLRLASNDY